MKLNLEHGINVENLFSDGFNVGTEEYKTCVLNGGRTGGEFKTKELFLNYIPGYQ